MKIVLTGASGFVGKSVLEKLIESGHHVLAISRSTKKEDIKSHPHATWILRDVCALEEDCEFMQGVDAVIHVAGEKRDEARMHDVNVEGVRRLLACAKQACVPLFIHLSSAGVYGCCETKHVTEHAVCHPMNLYEETKKKAEDVLQADDYKGRIVILRPTNIFDKETIRFFKYLRGLSLVKWLIKGSESSHWIYLEDVSNCIVNMLKLNGEQREFFNLSCVEGETLYYKELMGMVHTNTLIRMLFKYCSFPSEVPYMIRKFRHKKANKADVFYDPSKLIEKGIGLKYGTIHAIVHCLKEIEE